MYIQLCILSIVVDCGSPPPLENATINSQNSTVWGSNITYMCDEDNSIKQRTCQASGNWSYEDIRCCKFHLVERITVKHGLSSYVSKGNNITCRGGGREFA